DFPLVSPVQGTIAGNTTSLFSSTDGGATWTPADTRIPGRVFDISMNLAGTSALAITESGIYRTTDGGATWTRQFSAPSGVTALSRSQAAPSVIYAVCGTAVCRSADDGVTWASVAPPGPSGQIVADPLSAGTVYLQSASTWWKSTDNGSSWSTLTIPENGMMTAMIGAPDGALYAVVKAPHWPYPDLYKSTNQGGSWSPLNLDLPINASFSSHQLSVAGNAVYFASFSIYQTTNGGKKFTRTMGPESIYEIEVSPKDPSVQYAFGASGYVLKSADGGATWSATSQHLSLDGVFGGASSISHIVVDPANPSHLFAISPVNTAVFAAKLNSAGNSFTWSTVLGGSSSEAGLGIATDGAGNAFLTGIGTSLIPTTAPPLSGTSTSMSAFITKISDASGDCAPLLSASDQTITGQSQTLKFSVVAPGGCNWTASSDADWAAITSGASTNGAGLVTIQVAQNDGVNTRTATLKAANSSVKITQAGNSCSYSLDTPPSPYSADPPEYTVPRGGGAVTAVLTATDGCPWTVINRYPAAITVTSGSSGTGSGTIQLTVAPSPVKSMAVAFYLPVGTATIGILQLYAPPQDQLITFSPIPDQTLDFDPPPLAATASSNFPVTFTSSTMTVCQVSGYTVTLIATGTCSITANQVGNALWFPAPPVTQTFAVTAGPAVPQLAGIVNAASSNVQLPPGSYVAIYGHALAGHGNTSATALPLPTSLNGTQVTLGGLPMPLLYAASGQINALVPMGLTPNQSYPLVVTRDGIPSSPFSLRVGQVQPAIYSVNANGLGAGVVTNSLTGQLITQDNPASAGDYLTIYCNGLGPVHGPNGEAAPKDGAAAPLDLIYSTDATVTASLSSTTPYVALGNQPVVLFSGLTPSLAGLYQVNIQLPYMGEIYGTVTGSLTISTGGARSNQVSIYVH
ncbi:MAG TPA: YCF48-related protein, partial [Bryobacteraceae bacterium]